MEQVQLKVPDGVSSVSYGGTEYAVTKGAVSVPADAAADLLQQGFVLAG